MKLSREIFSRASKLLFYTASSIIIFIIFTYILNCYYIAIVYILPSVDAFIKISIDYRVFLNYQIFIIDITCLIVKVPKHFWPYDLRLNFVVSLLKDSDLFDAEDDSNSSPVKQRAQPSRSKVSVTMVPIASSEGDTGYLLEARTQCSKKRKGGQSKGWVLILSWSTLNKITITHWNLWRHKRTIKKKLGSS